MTKLPWWPEARVEEAMERLAGIPAGRGAVAAFAATGETQTWVYAAATQRGLEARPVHVRGAEIDAAVRGCSPLLLTTDGGLLALLRTKGRQAVLLEPDGGTRRVALAAVCDAVRGRWIRRLGLRPIDGLLEAAGVPASRRSRANAAFLGRQLAAHQVWLGWSIRMSPDAPIARQVARSGLATNLARVAVALVVAQIATIFAWATLGEGVLAGTFDPGWFLAWGLALATAAACHVLVGFWQGSAAIAFGGLIKKRLLLGALRLRPDDMRREGIGHALGRVLEAETMEDFALAGGFIGVMGFIELTIAVSILAWTSTTMGVMFIGLLLVTVVLCAAYHRRAARWTDSRLHLTHGIVERIIGNDTRCVQQRPSHWHTEEDQALHSYVGESRAYDRLRTGTEVFLQRGGLFVGLLALAPSFLHGHESSTLWIGLGGVLLAQRAMSRLWTGFATLAEASVAWRRAAALFRAARTPEDAPTPASLAAMLEGPPPEGRLLLQLRNVDFRFDSRRDRVLRGACLEVRVGDRVLVEGESGAGKSTLASIVAGINAPHGGLVLLDGLDRSVLGAAAWRKRIAAAPQYHDNHIFHETLAFNLLLGRPWPPSAEDLSSAAEICARIGLGDLLDRMPSGINQVVGAAGWQLSHGEQGRVFMARALLQRSDIVVLDESFAALDPETLERTMSCVRQHARTLICIAHP